MCGGSRLPVGVSGVVWCGVVAEGSRSVPGATMVSALMAWVWIFLTLAQHNNAESHRCARGCWAGQDEVYHGNQQQVVAAAADGTERSFLAPVWHFLQGKNLQLGQDCNKDNTLLVFFSTTLPTSIENWQVWSHLIIVWKPNCSKMGHIGFFLTAMSVAIHSLLS